MNKYNLYLNKQACKPTSFSCSFGRCIFTLRSDQEELNATVYCKKPQCLNINLEIIRNQISKLEA
jgi:hypothetical protein